MKYKIIIEPNELTSDKETFDDNISSIDVHFSLIK